ncbi:DUF3298 and DUF4163 domain-containing protein [Terrilactibacillus tamarindi]|nr:DUF3298 and DUF4163 domain-containing protein [Terrilactibacillus tamarindi]
MCHKSKQRRLVLCITLSMLFLFMVFCPLNQSKAARTNAVVIKIKELANDIQYPVITAGIKNKNVKNKINQSFLNHAKRIKKEDEKVKEQYEHDKLIGIPGPYYAMTKPIIRYNQDHRLSVSFLDSTFTGGAHGNTYEEVYNYNTNNGKRYHLDDIVRTPKQVDKVNRYIKKQLIELKESGRYDIFLDEFKGIDTKKDQFYFYKDGFVMVFQLYQIAPYSNGIIHMKVPYSVLQD